jgi:hypothetical protein
MSIHSDFNTFSANKNWQEKVHEGDAIWTQVRDILSAANKTLPETPRRPDVRMIIQNVSGIDHRFKNPGDHSGSKEELIPATGDKRAVMVMLQGATLEEQYQNAQTLYDTFNLGTNGLSPELAQAFRDGSVAHLVSEAYGPAPFAGQTEKLVDVIWSAENGKDSVIKPVKGDNASFGARAATTEKVFIAMFDIHVKGTGTTPEMVESDGIVIAVASDWQTGAETTRPIVPSVAQTYYGAHFADIPVVRVTTTGIVTGVSVKKTKPPATNPQPRL